MPTIIIIDNIKIRMFFEDHNPPHFHVVEGEHSALIAIENLEVIGGSLPRKTLQIVVEWAAENKPLLKDKWDEYQ